MLGKSYISSELFLSQWSQMPLGISEVSEVSGGSWVSGVSQVSEVSGVSEVSSLSQVSGISDVLGVSVISPRHLKDMSLIF